MGKTGLKLKAKKRKIPILSAKNSQSKCGITDIYQIKTALNIIKNICSAIVIQKSARVKII